MATVFYGILINVIVCGVFWYETVKVLKTENI